MSHQNFPGKLITAIYLSIKMLLFRKESFNSECILNIPSSILPSFGLIFAFNHHRYRYLQSSSYYSIIDANLGSSHQHFVQTQFHNDVNNSDSRRLSHNSKPLNVNEQFQKLMADQSLEPNNAQAELVRIMHGLQVELVRCDESSMLQQRLKEGYKELIAAQHQAVDTGSYIGSPSNFFLEFYRKCKFYWISNKQTTSIPFSNVSNPLVTELLELSQTPYSHHPQLKSLYIWGGVGQGKTMLMDAFFKSTPIKQKMRAHFHQFILDVQQQLHKLHLENQPKTDNSHFSSIQTHVLPRVHHHESSVDSSMQNWDPLLRVSYQLASNCRLLCLDEFQVIHIADAMILKRLFEGLLHVRLFIHFTS